MVDVGVCPEGLRRVPVSTAAQFSLLQPDQKGLQNESQNGAFWAPKSELYSLWGTFWEKLGPKNGEKKGHEKCSKKVTPELQGCAEILRFGGGFPAKIQRSDLRREENLMDTPLVP